MTDCHETWYENMHYRTHHRPTTGDLIMMIVRTSELGATIRRMCAVLKFYAATDLRKADTFLKLFLCRLSNRNLEAD